MWNLEKLSDLLSQPVAWGFLILCLASVLIGFRIAIFRWLLLGVTVFAASLSKFQGFFVGEPWPPYVWPVEPIVQNGRPLAVCCLLMLLATSFLNGSAAFPAKISPLLKPIHGIQAVLLAKLLIDGSSLSFTAQAAIIYISLGLLAAKGVREWCFTERHCDGIALALCVTGILFAVIGEYQLRVDAAPALLGGRFMGTTSNPQHAAVLLALCMLGPVYFMITKGVRNPYVMIPCGMLLALLVHLLFLTGSRTGLGMSALMLVVLLRRQATFGVILATVGVAIVLVVGRELLETTGIQEMVERGDTRTSIWREQWSEFLRYPLFGNPNVGVQLRPRENSWLGLLSAAGIVGGIALVWLTYEQIRTTLFLLKIPSQGRDSLDIDFCLAGWAGVIAGSFFEAYLLGVITAPIMCIVLLAASSEVIVSRYRQQTWGAMTAPIGTYRRL